MKEYIAEQNDLSLSEPEKAKELRQMLHKWRNRVGAKMMNSNPEYSE